MADINIIKFAKTKKDAIIPTKRVEDAGYDIYACFDSDFMYIDPHTTILIPTGIATAIPDDYVFIVKERGSTGSKGMAVRCGVIDSGYRNEIFVGITNTNDYTIVISKDENMKIFDLEVEGDSVEAKKVLIYPYKKAIAQLLLLPVPKVETEEISYDDLLKIESERGLNSLGSTNK